MTDKARSPSPIADATGYSDNHSFDEAFRDALAALPPPSITYPDQILRTQVVAVGSEIGGIAGFDRLYVRLRRLRDPLDLSSPTADTGEGETPFPTGRRAPQVVPDLGGGDPFPLHWPRPAGFPASAKRVFAVDSVKVDVAESKPPRFVISACGRVTTSGWSFAHLRPLPDRDHADDGVFDFELVAVPPSGIVLQVISPICTIAPLVWQPEDGATVSAIRVVAASNEVTVDVGAEAETGLKVGVYEDAASGGGG